MSPDSAVARHHQWHASEIDRLARRMKPDTEAEVRNTLEYARQHAAGMAAHPLHREGTKDPVLERSAAIVASAHAAASAGLGDPLGQATPKGPAAHDPWYRRLVDRVLEHSNLGAAKYEDFDVRWLRALVHRLETTPVAFPSGHPR